MREIKFRAWLKYKKEMVDNARPDFFSKQLHYLRDNSAGGKDVLGVSTEDIELMQYIGLKDKNGKEIYEGDIVTLHNGKYKVIFNSKEARFVLNDAFFDMDIPFTNNNNERMEIVGNIYENPELLGDKNDF